MKESPNMENEMNDDMQENMSEDFPEELPVKRRKSVRILAIIGLIIMVFLIGWLIFCLATGSKYTVAVLFVTIIYPVILYFFFWIRKVFSR